MGDLNTQHEEMLYTSLEDTDYWGNPIRIYTRDESLDYPVFGSINKIQPKMQDGAQGRPIGKSVGCSVRHTTLLEAAGYPVAGWEDRMPTFGWLVDLISPWTNELETFTLEKGSISQDRTLGLDTYWLTDYGDE